MFDPEKGSVMGGSGSRAPGLTSEAGICVRADALGGTGPGRLGGGGTELSSRHVARWPLEVQEAKATCKLSGQRALRGTAGLPRWPRPAETSPRRPGQRPRGGPVSQGTQSAM